MNITLPLEAQEEAKLLAAAKAKGVSAAALVREAVNRLIAENSGTEREERTDAFGSRATRKVWVSAFCRRNRQESRGDAQDFIEETIGNGDHIGISSSLRFGESSFVGRATKDGDYRPLDGSSKRNKLQSGDLLKMPLVACRNGVTMFQRASANEQVVEGDGDSLLR